MRRNIIIISCLLGGPWSQQRRLMTADSCQFGFCREVECSTPPSLHDDVCCCTAVPAATSRASLFLRKTPMDRHSNLRSTTWYCYHSGRRLLFNTRYEALIISIRYRGDVRTRFRRRILCCCRSFLRNQGYYHMICCIALSRISILPLFFALINIILLRFQILVLFTTNTMILRIILYTPTMNFNF